VIGSLLKLEMIRSSSVKLTDWPVGTPGENLGTGWILRQQRGDVLREEGAVIADPSAARGEATSVVPASSGRGWAAAFFAPLDGHFVQQVSGTSPFASDGEAPVGRTTGLSVNGALGEGRSWHFDGWAGRAFAEFDEAGGRLEDRNDRAAIGLDYRLGDRDRLTGDLWYGARRYLVEPDGETAVGTEQEQGTIALRSRWDRQLDADATLHVEGEFFQTDVRLPTAELDDERITDRRWLAAGGLALRSGDHSIDLGLQAEHYSYDLWSEGVLLHGRTAVPGPGIDAEEGPTFSLSADDRWRTGTRTLLSYGLRYRSQPGSGASYVVPRVGMTLMPQVEGGVALRSELLYRIDGDQDAAAAGAGLVPPDDRPSGREGDRIGYLIGIERRPDDRLQLSATYSYRPFVEGDADDAPLVLGDGSTEHHELELEMSRAFGAFRGRLAGKLGRAEGRLTPAMDEAPVQVLSDGEARYYQTQLWAAYGPTDTELQVDYRRILAEERMPGAAVDPLAYRRLDLVVYQHIPGPRALGDARLRVLMAYRGFDYDSLYDGPSGTAVSGRASRLTGGLDISF
jgi:hypothetical protein